jgi:hypothetical protein
LRHKTCLINVGDEEVKLLLAAVVCMENEKKTRILRRSSVSSEVLFRGRIGRCQLTLKVLAPTQSLTKF